MKPKMNASTVYLAVAVIFCAMLAVTIYAADPPPQTPQALITALEDPQDPSPVSRDDAEDKLSFANSDWADAYLGWLDTSDYRDALSDDLDELIAEHEASGYNEEVASLIEDAQAEWVNAGWDLDSGDSDFAVADWCLGFAQQHFEQEKYKRSKAGSESASEWYGKTTTHYAAAWMHLQNMNDDIENAWMEL